MARETTRGIATLILGVVLIAACTPHGSAQTAQRSAEDGRVVVRAHSGEWMYRSSHGDRTLEVRITGEVELTPDETTVERVLPGGRLLVEERHGSTVRRRMEFGPGAGGEVRRLYHENGRVAEMDGRVATWLGEILPEVARETGLAAEARVARLLARGGPAGVLEEVARIRSSGSTRRHLEALLQQANLTDAELVRVLGAAEQGVSSSGDKARLLTGIAARREMDDASVRRAFFNSVESITSGGDRRRVLTSVLDRDEQSAAVVIAAVQTAAGISSSGDKAAVLLAVPEWALRQQSVRSSYLETAGTIRSSSDHRRVLERLLAVAGDRSATTPLP
jgi:hypothetical protein